MRLKITSRIKMPQEIVDFCIRKMKTIRRGREDAEAFARRTRPGDPGGCGDGGETLSNQQNIMERWAGKNAVVTGAASGIGEAITVALLQHKVTVVAVDMQYDKLRQAADNWNKIRERGQYHLLQCDVTKEPDVDKVFNFVETIGGVDIMVNNAGIANFRRIIDSDWQSIEKMVNVFMLATPVFMSRAVRSMRKKNNEGHIININSIAGHMSHTPIFSDVEGSNGFHMYPACKHGTVALTESVRRELAFINAQIRVTSVSPGSVNTTLTEHNKIIYNQLRQVIEPEDVSDAVIYALSRRPDVEIKEIIVQQRGILY
ncbi:farnesol dehydrogenase isoform X1 [Megalopta genalis]|uniref:farnesol dehydrogenase isoform X1 n=2 Tax=Megalopta genalis TaxID=115081 RepID=UPI003FD21165